MLSSSVKLLLLMLRQGACSRADLAKTMHLSRPAVSALVDGLHRNKGEHVGNYVRLTRRDTEEIYRLAL